MKTHTQPDWNTLVSEFARLIGADGLEIDSAGACRLELGDGFGIDFEKDLEGGLHLYCTMPPVPEQDRPVAALRLLAENYSAQRHHSQASFAYDQGSGEFLLHLRLPDAIHGLAEFEIAVRDFTENAEQWTKVFHAGFAESSAPATSTVQMPHFA